MLSSYDRWLEEPYQRAIEESDRFVDWAEEEGYNLDNPEEVKEAERAYEDYMADMYEAKAEADYERYLDRKEVEMQERDWDY